MGKEQVGCVGGRVFFGRRCRRDHNIEPLVGCQPKADDGDVGRWGGNPENS